MKTRRPPIPTISGRIEKMPWWRPTAIPAFLSPALLLPSFLHNGPNPSAARSGSGRPRRCLDERLSPSVLSHSQLACSPTPSLSAGAAACPESAYDAPCEAAWTPQAPGGPCNEPPSSLSLVVATRFPSSLYACSTDLLRAVHTARPDDAALLFDGPRGTFKFAHSEPVHLHHSGHRWCRIGKRAQARWYWGSGVETRHVVTSTHIIMHAARPDDTTFSWLDASHSHPHPQAASSHPASPRILAWRSAQPRGNEAAGRWGGEAANRGVDKSIRQHPKREERSTVTCGGGGWSRAQQGDASVREIWNFPLLELEDR